MRAPEHADVQRISGATELTDDTLDAVVHLTGDGALALLGAAVAATGAHLESASIVQVSHEPGVACTVSYDASVTWPDGTVGTETLVAATTSSGPPEGAAVLESGGLSVGVWRYPFDPALPALVDAVYPDRLAQRLSHVGAGPWTPSVVGYRPGRRAVVRVEGPERTVFLKLVRPGRAAALARRHQALFEAGLPVPELLAADLEDGLLVLGALPGTVLRDRLICPGEGSAAAPSSAELAPMLATLASVRIGGAPARRRPLVDVSAHVDVLAAVLPELQPRCAALLARLRVDDPGDPTAIGAGRVVHGDLHDAQVMVDDDGRITGLLDLDDVGLGAAADDLGNLLGHAATMALVATGATGLQRWIAGVAELARLGGVERHEVARRAAAAVLSLATGPFRVREDGWQRATVERIALAELVLDGVSAERLGHVREVSDGHHIDLIATREN
jgi:aminoglycoside phosphotransferase (APT) family kinase protein